MDWYLALNAITRTSKFWKFVMEWTLTRIARWYEVNPNPRVLLRCECLRCRLHLHPDCYLYRSFNHYAWMNNWSIILSGIWGMPELAKLLSKEWDSFREFPDHIFYAMMWDYPRPWFLARIVVIVDGFFCTSPCSTFDGWHSVVTSFGGLFLWGSLLLRTIFSMHRLVRCSTNDIWWWQFFVAFCWRGLLPLWMIFVHFSVDDDSSIIPIFAKV